jgi:hypothetical protein
MAILSRTASRAAARSGLPRDGRSQQAGHRHMSTRRAIAAAVAGSAAAVYLGGGRSWQLRWGATDEEVEAALAGDDLIPAPDLTATRAITIHAPADLIWPWIAQLGQGRGGFYTYDWIENLLGLDMHSADHVVNEWQDIQAGDQIRLAAKVRLAVTIAEPGRALVIRGGIPMGAVPCPYDCTWGWVLREQHDGTTRLIARERYAYTRRWAPFLLEPVQVISFIMTQRMLRGIKERAERSALPAALLTAGQRYAGPA